MEAKELKVLPDDKLQENIDELNKKQDKTEDEVKELATLKEERRTRYQKKIDKMTWENKSQAEELERLRKENEELKKPKETPKEEGHPSIKHEFVEIDGKKWYTDETLASMVKSGEISDEQAWAHSKQRERAQTKAELRAEMKQEDERGKQEEIRKADVEKVRKEYPQFAKYLPDGSLNPDFTPDDPIYQKAQELFKEAYYLQPNGLSRAIERAKEILKPGAKPDRSDDLNLETSDVNTPLGDKRKEITLSEAEKEIAIRTWCRGDTTNPKTGKPYTETEACAKALQAKKSRMNK